MIKRKKRFITFFPKGENVHLIKDVGMIPFVLQKEGFYDSTIAFYESESNLPYLTDEVKGLKYKRIDKIFKNEELNIFIFLIRTLGAYDVIMLFHPGFKKALLVYFLRLLSFGRLKFYGKLDLDEKVFKQRVPRSSLKFNIGKLLFSKFTLISSESRKINDFINNETFMRSELIPNGFLAKEVKEDLPKENVFLTVGRIGSEQKNTETLLRALEKIDFKDWTFNIIGPIEKDFESVRSTMVANINQRNKVNFLGPISDREQLKREYSRAKVFCLTSRWEGFPLVLPEALSEGCFIVSTELSSALDITNGGKYGTLVPVEDDKRLAERLQMIINDELTVPSPTEIKEYAEANFSWKNIVEKIYYHLENS